MAGAFVIAEGKALSMSGVDFEYLVQAIRGAFLDDEEKIKTEIYRPLDEGGMDFISLREQDNSCFKVFFRATERAFCKASGVNRKCLWDELITLLKSDPRYVEGG
jgi:hypothetical protein